MRLKRLLQLGLLIFGGHLAMACTLVLPKPVPAPSPVITCPEGTGDQCSQSQLSVTIGDASGPITPVPTAVLVPDTFPPLGFTQPTPGRFSVIVPGQDANTGSTVTVSAPGYLPSNLRLHVIEAGNCVEHVLPASGSWEICPSIVLQPAVPPLPGPLTRDQRLKVHESFQGSVLHTTQFGDLPWWPTAWVSLNEADREAAYSQIAGFGDTDITVSVRWDYGEDGQPYGSGQKVPPADFTQRLGDFRALVEDVLRHHAANGRPFVPVVYLNCDTGFQPCMDLMSPLVAALSPMPGHPEDLANDYVKFRLCYDSCIPGYQPPGLVDQIILGLRLAAPRSVIAIEFASGFSFWGPKEGTEQFGTQAGQALDEVDWEGNDWPSSNLNQYWGIADHWLGPCFARPAGMPASFDPEAPYSAQDARFYLRMGTPRGPFWVDFEEAFTYQWVRNRVDPAQVPVVLAFIRSMMTSPDCASIDLPQ